MYKSLNKFHIGQNFEIGRIIVENQEKNQWGESIVDTLSIDINKQIDGVKGYSPQNLWRMRQFYIEYRLKLNQKEYFIDLLFYHRILKCLIVIELKTVGFEPEFAGKMNFYLELLDEQEKLPDDNPSIGIILCPIKDNIEVEYALRTTKKPIGVSEYKLTHKLPEKLKGKVPTTNELKQMLIKAIRNAGEQEI